MLLGTNREAAHIPKNERGSEHAVRGWHTFSAAKLTGS